MRLCIQRGLRYFNSLTLLIVATPVDCTWNHWSAWGSCSVPCVPFLSFHSPLLTFSLLFLYQLIASDSPPSSLLSKSSSCHINAFLFNFAKFLSLIMPTRDPEPGRALEARIPLRMAVCPAMGHALRLSLAIWAPVPRGPRPRLIVSSMNGRHGQLALPSVAVEGSYRLSSLFCALKEGS